MTNWLKRWAQKIAKWSGATEARVALARKMAFVLRRMWLDGTGFGAPTVNAARAARVNRDLEYRLLAPEPPR